MSKATFKRNQGEPDDALNDEKLALLIMSDLDDGQEIELEIFGRSSTVTLNEHCRTDYP